MNEDLLLAIAFAVICILFFGFMSFFAGEGWKTKIIGTLICAIISCTVTGLAYFCSRKHSEECGCVSQSHSTTHCCVCSECHTEISQ